MHTDGFILSIMSIPLLFYQQQSLPSFYIQLCSWKTAVIALTARIIFPRFTIRVSHRELHQHWPRMFINITNYTITMYYWKTVVMPPTERTDFPATFYKKSWVFPKCESQRRFTQLHFDHRVCPCMPITLSITYNHLCIAGRRLVIPLTVYTVLPQNIQLNGSNKNKIAQCRANVGPAS